MDKYIKIGIGVMILDGNKILLGHRAKNKKDTGRIFEVDCWTLPGGKQEYNETFFEGAKREVKEETNLDIDELELFDAADDIQPDRHYITMHVIARKHSGELKIMEPTKEDEWKWFDLDNLPEKLYSPSKKFIESYLNNKNKLKESINNNKNRILITGAVLSSNNDSVDTYNKIISWLDNNNYEISSPLDTMKFKGNDLERYDRAMQLLKDTKFMIAEMSSISTGQGMEVQEAATLNIPILVVAKTGSKISGLVKGCKYVKDIIYYENIEDIRDNILEFIEEETK